LIVDMTGDCTITFANSSDNLGKISAERLFDRFYTVETGSNSTGLGLSIAKLLVEQMNGTISAEIRGDKLFITVKL
ncbi:MAG: sensor histidine kinase, partial [Ruminococcaceae bacterium]|nr:sensor histidine kinase [Oscillospiraceae bacterium]